MRARDLGRNYDLFRQIGAGAGEWTPLQDSLFVPFCGCKIHENPCLLYSSKQLSHIKPIVPKAMRLQCGAPQSCLLNS